MMFLAIWLPHMINHEDLGVGTGLIMAREGFSFITPPPIAKGFAELNGKGRGQLYAIEIAPKMVIKV